MSDKEAFEEVVRMLFAEYGAFFDIGDEQRIIGELKWSHPESYEETLTKILRDKGVTIYPEDERKIKEIVRRLKK